eukprot:7204778-Pyramimonas_sp.AAC.1
MAPSCRPFVRWATCNYRFSYDAWLRSYQDAAPSGRFCGHISRPRLESDNYFVNEQPDPSWLCHERPWLDVLTTPGVDRVVFDQRMPGQ